jgi:pimeloyl-ACP methyl ester carboxylesterase
MTSGGRKHRLRAASTISADGTRIGYSSLGEGPGLIIVGGVLSRGADYLQLAGALARDFEVHLIDRRGRPSSGPQGPSHAIDDECADLLAVAANTGAAAVFGHSFGGLVVLETASRQPAFDQLFVYEPGVPLRGQLRLDWLDGYQQRLKSGDRRGAFAWMVKHNGFAPRPLAVMPLFYVRAVLRLAIRSGQWASMDPLLEANLVEHRIEAALDAPDAQRFSTIAARTLLMGGAKSPAVISRRLIGELTEVIPNATAATFPGLDHLAPQHQPSQIAAAILASRDATHAPPAACGRTHEPRPVHPLATAAGTRNPDTDRTGPGGAPAK